MLAVYAEEEFSGSVGSTRESTSGVIYRADFASAWLWLRRWPGTERQYNLLKRQRACQHFWRTIESIAQQRKEARFAEFTAANDSAARLAPFDPTAAAVRTRTVMEQMIRWLYDVD